MIIKTIQTTSLEELRQLLKNQFSDYTISPFGVASQKSIIVRESAFVAAQITVRKDEILIEPCFPNLFISSLMSILTISTIFPFIAWANIEKKISHFLFTEYK